jgi:predicted nicotinamide N-methyase
MKNQMEESFIKELKIGKYFFHILQYKNTLNLLDRLLLKGDLHPDVKDERIPYWLEIWPSAFVLASHIMERGIVKIGLKSLEIGCGIGLPSMVCKKLGGEPHLTDYTDDAIEFCEKNWNLNFHEPMSITKMDWREPHENLKSPLLLASDVAYEKRNFAYLLKAFKKLVTLDGLIVFSEPSRKVAIPFIESLPFNGFKVETFNYQGFFEGTPYNINVFELKIAGLGSKH